MVRGVRSQLRLHRLLHNLFCILRLSGGATCCQNRANQRTPTTAHQPALLACDLGARASRGDLVIRMHFLASGTDAAIARLLSSAMKRVLLSWSSGKDSAWTLHVLRRDPSIEFCGLLTTLNTEFDRVAMHGVRRTVLEAQAAAAGLPLWIVPLPWPCSNEIYEQRMAEVCRRAIDEHIDAVAFGDLFLEDVRAYRERNLAPTGLEPLFPLWQIPTDALAREMIAGGLRARISCVDTKSCPPAFAGREFDEDLLRDFPPGTDPCGERGEFHTCVYAGPMFSAPLPIETGEIVTRDGFVFADFLMSSIR